MGKLKILIAVAAAACPILAGSSTAAGEFVRGAAVIAAGGGLSVSQGTLAQPPLDGESAAESTEYNAQNEHDESTEYIESYESYEPFLPETEPAPVFPDETAQVAPIESERTEESAFPAGNAQPVESLSPAESGVHTGRVISRSISQVSEDLSGYNAQSGAILREHYGVSQGEDHITLSSGAQVRSCTTLPAEQLLEAAEQLPAFRVSLDADEPQVLIVHTHTTEDYEPTARGFYDADFPTRTLDGAQNVTAVGEALAQALAERGVSVLHDGTVHDSPVYTGAYDRSEATIRAALEEYPSIKVVIDLHRDAMENSDGARIAPVTEINGRNAAQFMIIAGCDNGLFNMPDYMENFKFACLIQNTAQRLYPELARPVLFDYRNYNQHITTGSLLIEVGSHANSLDEAKYTGELLGEILAQALYELA